MKYAIVFSLLLLTGCANQAQVLANKDVGKVMVPSADRPACPELPFPSAGSLSEEQTGEVLADWSKLYKRCSDRGDRLLGIIDAINDPKK